MDSSFVGCESSSLWPDLSRSLDNWLTGHVLVQDVWELCHCHCQLEFCAALMLLLSKVEAP